MRKIGTVQIGATRYTEYWARPSEVKDLDGNEGLVDYDVARIYYNQDMVSKERLPGVQLHEYYHVASHEAGTGVKLGSRLRAKQDWHDFEEHMNLDVTPMVYQALLDSNWRPYRPRKRSE